MANKQLLSLEELVRGLRGTPLQENPEFVKTSAQSVLFREIRVLLFQSHTHP
jgi:hypothetical protein